MAGRKLTDEEKALYNKRMAMTRQSKEDEANAKLKAKWIEAGGEWPPKPKNTRTAEQIMSDIEKVKQDPKFQKTWEKYKAAQEAKGTQADHHVTTGKNTTKPARGGFAGGGFGVGLMPGEQIK